MIDLKHRLYDLTLVSSTVLRTTAVIISAVMQAGRLENPSALNWKSISIFEN